MNDPQLPVSSPVVVLPATVPLEEQIRMNLDDLVSTGMENRFELGQQLLRMDSANIATKVAKNNLLPQLNLVGSVGVEGLNDDWTGAVDNQFTGDHVSWSAGVQFELPFGNRAARAIWKRTLLQRQQAIAQYQALIDKTTLEVKQALRDVETSWEEIYATRKSRFAASDALRAIEQREEGGEALSYSFVDLKLTTQQRYAEAQSAEVASISNYNRALARLEFAKGTLLRYNNIVMEEAPLVKY
jgi:outer membrane protein TolC